MGEEEGEDVVVELKRDIDQLVLEHDQQLWVRDVQISKMKAHIEALTSELEAMKAESVRKDEAYQQLQE